MGILLQTAGINLVAAGGNPVTLSGNSFTHASTGWKITFSIRFDPRSTAGFGGSPSANQDWTIGIVQNVLFERISLEYFNGSLFERDFNDAVLDSNANIFNRPFVYDWPPPSKPPGGNRPYASITYTSAGYDELVDPFGGPITNRPSSFEFLDTPNITAKFRVNGSMIKQIEHLLSVQVWLVAFTPASWLVPPQPGGTMFVIASVPPFTTSSQFTITAQPNPFQLQLAPLNALPAAFDFDQHFEVGIVKSFAKRPSSRPPLAVSGNGGRAPIVTGITANDRGNAWLRANGLI